MGKPLVGVEHGEGRGQAVEAAEARLDRGPALGVARVASLGLGIEQSAQRGDLGVELPVLLAKAGKLEPLAGEVAHLQHDHAAGGAAVDLDMPLALGPQHAG